MSINNNNNNTDVADGLAGLQQDAALWQLRAARVDVKNFLQGSDVTLFEPIGRTEFGVIERHLIGLRVGVITRSDAIVERHRAALNALGADAAQVQAVEAGAHGELPKKIAAALRFSDKITREPRDASPEDIAELKASGFVAQDLVTLGQLISYLSFQVRLLAGLRALGGAK